MKIVQMILIVIGSVVLTIAESYAASPNSEAQQAPSASSARPNADSTSRITKAAAMDEKSQREQNHVKMQANGKLSIKDRALDREGERHAANRVTQENGKIRPAGPAQFANTQKGVPHAIQASRSFAPNRSSIRPLATMAHRGANPPAVGGAVSTNRVRAMAIDGTRVQRKP